MATPSYVTSVGTGVQDGGATSVTSPSITPSGSNRIAIIHVTNSDGSPANPTGVTLDGNACTQLGSTQSAGTFWRHSVWYYKQPATSAMTATATFAANQGERLIQVAIYSDVDQSTPFGTPVQSTAGSASTVTNNSIGAAADDLIIDCVLACMGSIPDTDTLAPNSSQNERVETKTAPIGYDAAAIADLVAGSTSVTRSYRTALSSSPDGWAMTSVAVKAASGAVDANPTGTSGTGASGSVATRLAKTLSGVAATAAVGTLAAIMGQSVSGVSASGAAGTLTASGSASTSITGVSGAGQVGTLSAGVGAVTANVTGVSAAGSASSLGPVLVQIEVQGVNASGSVGTMTATGKASASISGAAGSGQVGTLVVTGDIAAILSGVSASGQVGTLRSLIAQPIVGLEATGAAGSLQAKIAQTLGGVSGAGQVGALSVNGALAQQITGVSGSGQVGTLTADAATYKSLTGVFAEGQVGSISITQSGSFVLIGASAAGAVGTITAQAGGILDSVQASVSMRPMSNTAEIWKGQ